MEKNIREEIESKGKSVKWNGKKLGHFLEEKNGGIGFTTFITNRKQSKHLFHSIGKNGSWGINKELLKDMCNRFVDRIIVNEDETGDIYITSPEVWLHRGVDYHNKRFELQIMLPLENFKIIRGRSENE